MQKVNILICSNHKKLLLKNPIGINMQYALMKVSNTKVLIDALELHAITNHKDQIQDVAEADEENLPFKIVYGSYLPQYGQSIEDATEAMIQSNHHWLGYVRDNQCFKIGLTELKTYEAVPKGKTFYIPFSALVSTNVDVNKNSRKAISAFLRYSNIRPDENILNRKGFFAINAQENRIKHRNVTQKNWLEFIDDDRAILSASKIY